jgi:hypothetical protein
MSNIKWISLGVTLLLQLGLLSGFAHAAQTVAPSAFQTVEGKIELIDTKEHILLVNDRGYFYTKDVVVKTASGRIGRFGQLYRGKRVKMEVEYSGGDGNRPVIHTIYLLR